MTRNARKCDVQTDDTDLRIVHALQIDPRAPWRRVGQVLGLDPVTAARRWERLERAGVAWVHTSAALVGLHGTVGAWLEISTEARATDAVAAVLAAEPIVISLRRVSGRRDLIALMSEMDFGQLVQLVNDRLVTIPGVLSTRTHVITASPQLGNDWRLDRLEPAEVARLRPNPPEAPPRHPTDRADEAIIAVLNADGRASVRDIARAASVSTATAARRLGGLLASNAVYLHCDVSRELSGFPVSTLYFCSVPAENIGEVTAVLRGVAEVRICVVVAGPANLVIDVWLRTLDGVHSLEASIGSALAPLGFRVLDRCVTLRNYKHHGRLIDADGRAVREAR